MGLNKLYNLYKAVKPFAKRKKVSPTITSIKPTFPKTVRQKNSRDLKQFGRMVKAKTKKMGDDVSLKVNEISQKLKKIRESKMGGGMMGRPMYKKGSKKAVGKSNLGMQSVIHGIDNNPKITAADPKAKFIAKNKKT